MRKKILVAGAGVVCSIAAVATIGYLLPVAHKASRTIRLTQPIDRVFATITDFERQPEWRTGIRAVVTDGAGAGATVREDSGDATITYRVEALEAPRLLRMRIADASLPFGGTWTYQLRPAEAGTELTITEDGEVYNPIFRFMSRFVFGHHATIDQYLDDLRRRLQ